MGHELREVVGNGAVGFADAHAVGFAVDDPASDHGTVALNVSEMNWEKCLSLARSES